MMIHLTLVLTVRLPVVPLALAGVQQAAERVHPHVALGVGHLHGGRLLPLRQEPRGQLALALHRHLEGEIL